MSKLKRKWLRVIEHEEAGLPLDDATRQQLDVANMVHPALQDHQDSSQVSEGAMPPVMSMQSHLGEADFQHDLARFSEQHAMQQDSSMGDLAHDPSIDSRLEQQIQNEITAAAAAAAAAAAVEAQENQHS